MNLLVFRLAAAGYRAVAGEPRKDSDHKAAESAGESVPNADIARGNLQPGTAGELDHMAAGAVGAAGQTDR